MTLAPTGDLVAAAVAAGTAVAAVNVITLEHAEAIAAAAETSGTAVVMQLSENAVRYHGGRLGPIAAATHAIATAATTPVALHLDHVTDDELVAAALEPPFVTMFTSVMYDAGHLPYGENVSRTADVARRAHAAGLWVEAELGYVGGKPDAVRSAHAEGVRTDPAEAERFVAETGVDALAVAVGSSHAMTDRTARLDIDLVAALRDRLPVPLVLHGSSGVPDDELRRAVAAGIGKVNVGTLLNVALTGAVRDALTDPRLTDPRKYLAPGRDAMRRSVDQVLATLRPLG
ncbi:fructose-bisphosphate aldolase [Jatrophihabitans endophyticus]|uniref:Fructose-bisphosphate aldolase n=1 Tax=Jatrophihabitans endophyticus TaxID=1206085 RepID=A0A1M5T0M3_9ACTN|nr:class II fructose-bisphosphate aldolase [Jatrophihabitans endophyticus]SHH44299.1 fructose-bisphosphate aldolase [Jatrophihabitans endophyticus]